MQLQWNMQIFKIYKIIFDKNPYDLSLTTRLILTPFIMESSTMFWFFFVAKHNGKQYCFSKTSLFFICFDDWVHWRSCLFFSSRKKNPLIMSDRSLLGSMPRWPSCTYIVGKCHVLVLKNSFSPLEQTD